MATRLLGAGIALMLPLAAPAAARGQEAPPSTVPEVDFNRYAGTWFELARFPNRFQRDCAGEVTATYAVREDGRIDVVNRCRTKEGGTKEAEGIARPASEGETSKLEVRFAPGFLSFLPFVWGDYWIIDLADDYSTAVVGSPDREYLWVLSRTPSMTADVYQQLVAAAAREGFDVDRLVRTAQD